MITALKLARMNKGLTQKELGELIKMNKTTISSVELRRMVVSEKNKLKIAKAMGGKVEDFFDRENGLAI